MLWLFPVKAWKCLARWIGFAGPLGSDFWPSDQCGGTQGHGMAGWMAVNHGSFLVQRTDVGFEHVSSCFNLPNEHCALLQYIYTYESANGNRQSYSWISMMVGLHCFIMRLFTTCKSWAYWLFFSSEPAGAWWFGAAFRFWVPRLVPKWFGGFHKWGGPWGSQNGWFIMIKNIKIDDLGAPPFQETLKWGTPPNDHFNGKELAHLQSVAFQSTNIAVEIYDFPLEVIVFKGAMFDSR